MTNIFSKYCVHWFKGLQCFATVSLASRNSVRSCVFCVILDHCFVLFDFAMLVLVLSVLNKEIG